MRKNGLKILLLMMSGLLMTSCFKSEPYNDECDIEKVWVSAKDYQKIFFHATDTIKEVSSSTKAILFETRKAADLTQIVLNFKLTPGAKISPEAGKANDFSKGPILFTVTSESGAYTKSYLIQFENAGPQDQKEVSYDFENYELEVENQSYYNWYEVSEDKHDYIWGNCNPGFKLSRPSAKPQEYPVIPLERGQKGHGVQLTTRSTGPLGALVGRPIASASLFLGTFDMTTALTESLKCTKFGWPYTRYPRVFSGYYTYKPGPEYTDKDGNVLPVVDQPAIYAIMYKNHDESGKSVVLTGETIKTSPLIVAAAPVQNLVATDEWTQFEVPFIYLQEIDDTLLKERGYSLAIICASSQAGDYFMGAVGSTLCIDSFTINTWEE